MNKLDKNKQIERPKVEPLGDMRIAEARSKSINLDINPYYSSVERDLMKFRFPGANEKRNN